MKFCNETNLRVLISDTTLVFQNSSSKKPKEAISGPKFRHFYFFLQNFASQQSSVCRIEISQSCFKILAQKRQNKAFLIPYLGIFAFSCNFATRQIWVCSFKIPQEFFEILAQKHQIRLFYSHILAFFLFCEIFQVDKFVGADFKYDRSILKFLSQNTEIRHFVSNF